MTGPEHPEVAVRLDGVGVWRYRPEDAGGSEILRDVTLCIGRGEHWAVLGPNGAGKTTLLDVCGARCPPSRGRAVVLGHEIGSVDVRDLRREIGHVGSEQRTWHAGLSAVQVVLTGARSTIAFVPGDVDAPARAGAEDLLADVGCGALVNRAFSTLSRGERQRVMLARALLSGPGLVLLDEPAAGLDLAGREGLLATLTSVQRGHPGRTTITVTHHLEELPAGTTHAVLLRAGRIVASGPAEAVLTSEPVSDCFGVRVAVTREGGRTRAVAVDEPRP